ncbi:MAG: type III-B CRISPR module-associated protein Cmr3 [Acidobacteria bacterium]|nr:type III-B CRISPR module-associated protein Cmr3 [Acidobacteriota bacterium]
MAVWIIEPRDPLIVRDARPFGNIAGTRATSLDFPFPSTTTGGARTRAGLVDGIFDKVLIDSVKQISVRGPLLAELGEDGEIKGLLFTSPADALLLKPDHAPTPGIGDADDEDRAQLIRLYPLDPNPGLTNISDVGQNLMPLGSASPSKGKPHEGAPRYWHWSVLRDWLLSPEAEKPVSLRELGHDGPLKETRTHVRIQRGTQTAEDSALFQTSGLEFHRAELTARGGGLGGGKRLALVVEVDENGRGQNIEEGLAPFGGERRLVMWRKSAASLPTCPAELRRQIAQDRHCRLLLLTPACFGQGVIPQWLTEELGGVRPELKALASGRMKVVSGWDFARGKSGEPKPTRRLVPAGAVIFLKLKGEGDIGRWVEETWMSCVSDEVIDRADGFGLAVLGTWDGGNLRME